jgi:hypothetical protein
MNRLVGWVRIAIDGLESAHMPILTDATTEEVERLLALFPAANLRQTWTDFEKLSKEQLCKTVALQRPRAEVLGFVRQAFGCCKQHIHLFSHELEPPLAAPDAIVGGEKLVSLTPRSAIYLTRSTTDVVLLDPYDDGTIDFLWPVRIEVTAQHVIVSLVILEKDIESYFPRRALVEKHGLSEEAIVADIVQSMGGLQPLDIHKGIKTLWHEEYMDCHFAKYRKAKSAAYEIVDRTEKKGIRENDPTLYAVLRKARMTTCTFHLDEDQDQETSVRYFGADLSLGTLSFSTYADNPKDTGDVVRKILQNN